MLHNTIEVAILIYFRWLFSEESGAGYQIDDLLGGTTWEQAMAHALSRFRV
jgi:hypothetical protein